MDGKKVELNTPVAPVIRDTVSVVAAFLDESECITSFCEYMENLAKTVPFAIELILVNDGSSDDSADLIANFTFTACDRVQLITLSKNFGSHAATRAGLLHATGDYAVFLGVDLQEPDTMLEVMYDRIKDGYHAVYVEKDSTQVSFGEKFFSRAYSFLMRKFAVRDYSSKGVNNIMMDRKVLDFLNSNVEANSSLHLQIISAEFKHATVSLRYKARNAGASKWTFSKKLKLSIDSFVAFSYLPIRTVTFIGIVMALVGFVYMLVIVVSKLLTPESIALGYPTIISVVLIGFGVTNISLGIIAEYLWRTFDAARNRPVFIISESECIKERVS